MPKLTKKHAVYSLIALAAVVVISLVASLILYFSYKPHNVVVTNVTDRSVTVTWTTDRPAEGSVIVENGDFLVPVTLALPSLDKNYDDRDVAMAEKEAALELNNDSDELLSSKDISEIKVTKLGKYYTHHVTVKNLSPDKTYTFKIRSGAFYIAADWRPTVLTKFTTFKELEEITTPDPAYGVISERTDNLYVLNNSQDALVYLTVNSTKGRSNILSAVVNQQGGYYFDLTNAYYNDGARIDTGDEETFHSLNVIGAPDFLEKTFTASVGSDAPFETLILEKENSTGVKVPEEDVQGVSLVFDANAQEAICPNTRGERYCEDSDGSGNCIRECTREVCQESNGSWTTVRNAFDCQNVGGGSTGGDTAGGSSGGDTGNTDGSTPPAGGSGGGRCPGGKNPGDSCRVTYPDNRDGMNLTCTAVGTYYDDCTCSWGPGSSCRNEEPLPEGEQCVLNGQPHNSCSGGACAPACAPGYSCQGGNGDTSCCTGSCVERPQEPANPQPSDPGTSGPSNGNNGGNNNPSGNPTDGNQTSDHTCDINDFCTEGEKCGTVTDSPCTCTIGAKKFTIPAGAECKLSSNSSGTTTGGTTSGGNNPATPTAPVVGGACTNAGVVEVVSPNKCLRCVASGAGKAWVNHTCPAPVSGPQTPVAGNQCSPVGEKVDLGGNLCMVCKSGSAGSDVWQTEQCSPVSSGGGIATPTSINPGEQCPQYAGIDCACNGNKITPGKWCVEVTFCADGSSVGKVCKDNGDTCMRGTNSWSCWGGSPTVAVIDLKPGEKCPDDAVHGCYCPWKRRDTAPGEFCNEVQHDGFWYTSCSEPEHKGKICREDGTTCVYEVSCPSGNPQDPSCTYDTGCHGPKVTSSKNELISEAKGVSLVSKVNAQQPLDIVKEEGAFIFNRAGYYCGSVDGSEYCFVIDQPGRRTLYVDVNNNNSFDESDIVISDLNKNIELEKREDTSTIALKQGFNIVSIDIVNELINTGSKLATYIQQQSSGGIYSVANFSSGRWDIVSVQEGQSYSTNDFPLIPGKGYLIRSKRDLQFTVSGRAVASPVPITFSPGWNLIAIHGANTQYTAESLIDAVDSTNGFDANNVTKWTAEKGRYEGVQKQKDSSGADRVFGFDFPLVRDAGYFVRIVEGQGEWAPE